MMLRKDNDLETTSIFDQREERRAIQFIRNEDLKKVLLILDIFANIALVGAIVLLTIRFTEVGLPSKFIIPTNQITWAGILLITVKLGISYFKIKLEKMITQWIETNI